MLHCLLRQGTFFCIVAVAAGARPDFKPACSLLGGLFRCKLWRFGFWLYGLELRVLESIGAVAEAKSYAAQVTSSFIVASASPGDLVRKRCRMQYFI